MAVVQETRPPLPGSKNVVFVSAVHDFRTLRRGSIQALASAMAKMGHAVTFVSVRFSLLSLIKGDSRSFLWRKANTPELVNGVVCHLWFTFIHPFQSKNRFFELLFRPHYSLHKRLKNRFVDRCFRNADFIVIESGQGILFAGRARRLNPSAKIIYRASDKLSTIGASEILQAELEKNADIFDWFCLLSADMADEFAWAREKTFCVPLGIDPEDYRNNGPNPYVAPINAVTVGSMLFDPSFFQTAAVLFPAIQFHLIGCGVEFDAPQNVRLYDEMAFKDTLRYIEHASFGIAPYRDTKGADYLATSSLKLKQYEYMGIPAVCPVFAVGQSRNRFGYAPADKPSIECAINEALNSAFVAVPAPLSWKDLAVRLLDPQRYPDCEIPEMTREEYTDQRIPSIGVVNVSLVVCTFGNRKKQLLRLIESLKTQHFNGFEVILVDQNRPGYLDDILQTNCAGIPLKQVRSDRGLSIARNVGMIHASGAIVGFPDDDCWYLPETLAQVASFFRRNPKVDILLGRTVDALGAPSLSPLRKQSGAVNPSNVWISGNSNTLFVRKEAIPPSGFDEKLGVGAPTRYQSGEETDFILTLMKNRARAVYISDLQVCHDQVEDVGTARVLKRAWIYSLGFGYVLKKHEFGFGYLGYRVGRSIVSAIWAVAGLRPVYGIGRMVWSAGTLVGYISARP
jgi:2-beta-glucuronyltransferase